MIRVERLPADLLDLPPIASEVLAGRLAIEGLPLPRRAADVERPPERLDRRERAALAARIEAGLAPLSPHVAVLDAARSLAEEDACVVVAGQQPGLLVSPLLVLYKALHALALARDLQAAWGVPVAALFWNHADDHDVAEVHHTHVVNANLDVQRVGLAGLSSGRRPFSEIALDDATHRLSGVRALLADLARGEPFAGRALDALFPRSGESLARAFTRGLTELLGRQGLVVLEPAWIRADLSAALARIVSADAPGSLLRGAERERASGREPPIDPREAALVYAHEAGGRRALRPGGEGYRYDGESGSRTGAELAAEIVQDPAAWSPGALLRPIVQDLCLPVAAYVGGWAELAYYAELPELRRAALAPLTPFVPRVSCTLLDPETRASLARLESTAAEVLRGRGASPPGAGRGASPSGEESGGESASIPAVAAKLRAISARAAGEIAGLKAELSALDPSLAAQLAKAADGVRSAAERLAEKVERVHDNRTGKGRRHLRRVTGLLYPRGEPQERMLGPLPFVARFGEDWIGELGARIDPFGLEHLLVHLGPGETPLEPTMGDDA